VKNNRTVFLTAFSILFIVYILICTFNSDVIKFGLRQIEFSTAVPGLSGLVLLVTSPFLFLLSCAVIEWLTKNHRH